MKSTPKTLLALLAVLVGVTVGTTNSVAAAEQRKQTASSKKEPRHASRAAKKQRVAHARQQPQPAVAEHADAPLKLASSAVVVIDQSTGDVLYEKNANTAVPIASITKLMTAMVVLDAHPNLSETLTVTTDDIDTLKGTQSRLSVGTQLSREEMLRLALMSSENRASSALSRHYPGGRSAFVAAMNAKARQLGLNDTHFQDPTGLTPANVASARDLVTLVDAAHQYPLIREFSTLEEYQVAIKGRPQTFRNTNSLVKNDSWNIGLSKTGYISEAGKCLVMQAWLNNKPTIIVLLDSWGKLTRVGDAQRIKRWVEAIASSSVSFRG